MSNRPTRKTFDVFEDFVKTSQLYDLITKAVKNRCSEDFVDFLDKARDLFYGAYLSRGETLTHEPRRMLEYAFLFRLFESEFTSERPGPINGMWDELVVSVCKKLNSEFIELSSLVQDVVLSVLEENKEKLSETDLEILKRDNGKEIYSAYTAVAIDKMMEWLYPEFFSCEDSCEENT